MALTHHSTSPVPLYLIPQALAEEIRKFGDTMVEVRIRRTTGHNYVIRIKHELRGEGNE